jgi:hypothetical protein
MHRHNRNLVAAFVVLLSCNFGLAAVSPLSVSIIPPVQFPPEDFAVTGLRASVLWGHHRSVYGFDFGAIGNITEQTFTGIGISGIFNYTAGQTTAIVTQLAGVTNINKSKTRVYGLQAAVGANINTAESTVAGLQFAMVNMSAHTTIYGVQAGVYNKAKSVYGIQVGLINVCTDLHGLQIGLLNFHHQGVFAVSPIINFGF